MSQTEIRPGTPKVLGIDRTYPGLLNVEIPLDPTPDRYWTEIFNRGPAGVGFPAAGHEPHIVGGRVRLQPPDAELEKFIHAVLARIKGTNHNYAERVAPRLKAEREAAERNSAEKRRRIEEAQTKLKDIGA
jgi:hypothetical protein